MVIKDGTEQSSVNVGARKVNTVAVNAQTCIQFIVKFILNNEILRVIFSFLISLNQSLIMK